MIKYGFKKKLSCGFEDAEKKVREALESQGFGVLTRIDISSKLKEKLGKDFRKYIILGACNPPNAYKALQAEEDIGLFLPCNVVVYEGGDNTVFVSIVKPSVAMGMIENPELEETAAYIENRLKQAFDEIS